MAICTGLYLKGVTFHPVEETELENLYFLKTYLDIYGETMWVLIAEIILEHIYAVDSGHKILMIL